MVKKKENELKEKKVVKEPVKVKRARKLKENKVEKVIFSIAFPKSLYERLGAAADADYSSRSSIVCKALECYLD